MDNQQGEKSIQEELDEGLSLLFGDTVVEQEEKAYAAELILELGEWVDSQCVAFRIIHVDIAGGDVISGLLLSQIRYWFTPDRNGKTKLRVHKDGKLWLAKSDKDWYEECRITEKQARRARGILEDLGLITTRVYRFNNVPTTHILLNTEQYWISVGRQYKKLLKEKEPQFALQGELDLPHRANYLALQGKSLTETTTEITTESKPASSGPPSPPAGEEKEVVEPTPLLIEEDYTLEVYYKDADRVKAKGRVKEGPWSVKCDCGNTVQIDRFNAPADCSCGMHEIVLVERKPGGAVKKKSAAVDLYYRIAAAQVRYGSMEEWEADISATVSDLDRWRAVVKTAVSSRSINPRNIANLLNCYRDDRLPGQKKGGAVDSRPSKVKRIIKQEDGTEREVEYVRMPQNGGNTR